MNDLGMTIAWSALRVSLLMVPAGLLYVLAARRSPATGSWAASIGLGATLAMVFWGFVPSGISPVAARTNAPALPRSVLSNAEQRLAIGQRPEISLHIPSGWSLAGLKGVLAGMERRVLEPSPRRDSFSRWVAYTALGGISLGLARFLLGLGAVSLCRRRGTSIHDDALIGMHRSLCSALKIRRPVPLQEVADLASPATAGWLFPVILLPDDWRDWDEHERRAVLAHELAHVRRGDYAAGLLARLAVVVNVYHPAVRWLSARLLLQQELAADALGAEHAGGRAVYLRALSSLALRQEGRIPHGPARAFLPARGTLIRRIAMLRKDERMLARPWSRRGKFVATALLLSLAVGVGSLRGPARAEKPLPPSTDPKPGETQAQEPRLEPFDLSYITDNAMGFAAIRPAALFRRSGMGRFATMFNLASHQALQPLAMMVGVTMKGPEEGPLRVEMIEQASCTIEIQTRNVKEGPKHALVSHTLMARTAEPFDWVKLARDWKVDLTEVSVGDRRYYRMEGKLAKYFGPSGAFFCPDDRTVIVDDEKGIVKLLQRKPNQASPYNKAKGWDTVGRGLIAVAIDNRNGSWTKDLADLPADERPPIEKVDFWCGGVADADKIDLRGFATCKDEAAAEATATATFKLIESTRKEGVKPPEGPQSVLAFRLFTNLLKNVHVLQEGSTVTVGSSVAESLADFGDVMSQGN